MAAQSIQVVNNFFFTGSANDLQPEKFAQLVEAVKTATTDGLSREPEKKDLESRFQDLAYDLSLAELKLTDAGAAWGPVKRLLERIMFNTEQEKVCEYIKAARGGDKLKFYSIESAALLPAMRQIIVNEKKGLHAQLAVAQGLIRLGSWWRDGDTVEDFFAAARDEAGDDNDMFVNLWLKRDVHKAIHQGKVLACLLGCFCAGFLPMILADWEEAVDVHLPMLQVAVAKLGKGDGPYWPLWSHIVEPFYAGEKPAFGKMCIEEAVERGEKCSVEKAFELV